MGDDRFYQSDCPSNEVSASRPLSLTIAGPTMKLLMMAGEVSGDYQASFLARALQAKVPGIGLFGTGGVHMREAGVDLRHDTAHLSSVGFLEPMRHLLPLQGVYRDMTRLVRRERPDLAILVDNQGFNLAIGRVLHSLGVPVIFYFPPQIWVGAAFFARSVAKVSRLVISAFPREAEIYRTDFGANAVSYGHPLLDIVKPEGDPEDALRRAGLDPSKPVIGLMPGSRRQEVKELARVMVESARIIKRRHPEMQFILPLAAEHVRPMIRGVLDQTGLSRDIALIERDRYACLSRCELVVTCSGTATLELSLLRVPLVAVYRLDPVSHWFARRLSMTPYVAMPNVLAGKMVVPEIMQYRLTPEHFAGVAMSLLQRPDDRRKIRERLAEIPGHLGACGAVDRTADRIIGEVEACLDTAG